MFDSLTIVALADLVGDIGMVLIAAVFFLGMLLVVELFERV
jgi:hypothetical protein